MSRTNPPARVPDKAGYLTPRDVGQRIPHLTRRELSLRRTLGLPPRFEIVSGCVMYSKEEIERFRIQTERYMKRMRLKLCEAAEAVGDGGDDGALPTV